MLDVIHDEPEVAWTAILRLSENQLRMDQIAVLAAGPLETLLSTHGPQFIERIEVEAKRSQPFNHLLGGVWPSSIDPHIWDRVVTSRKAAW